MRSEQDDTRAASGSNLSFTDVRIGNAIEIHKAN